MIPVDGIITNQEIDPELLERAKQLRSNMTPEEKIVWGHLRAGRINRFHFRRQQIIDGYIVDFYCHKANLVIEVDGPIHRSQEEYDRELDECLSSLGLTVLHIYNEEIAENINKVLLRIVTVLIKNTDAK
ncbi:MAG: DUF559 domain-containing protein [Anaerolineaceae bacterium]